jgi:hypothetical protein
MQYKLFYRLTFASKKNTIFSSRMKKNLFSRYQNDIIMNGKTLFSEQQKFRQPWLWVIMIAMLGIPALNFWDYIQQVVHGHNPTDDKGLLFSFIIITVSILAAVALMWITRLETSVTENEISIKYFPLHRSFKNYKWEDIANASIQKFNPLKYGGFGIRSNSGFRLKFGSGGVKVFNYQTYNLSRKYVLELELKNGKKVVIGTQKEKELEAVIDKIIRTNKEY